MMPPIISCCMPHLRQHLSGPRERHAKPRAVGGIDHADGRELLKKPVNLISREREWIGGWHPMLARWRIQQCRICFVVWPPLTVENQLMDHTGTRFGLWKKSAWLVAAEVWVWEVRKLIENWLQNDKCVDADAYMFNIIIVIGYVF